jgi:hypothetical protein
MQGREQVRSSVLLHHALVPYFQGINSLVDIGVGALGHQFILAKLSRFIEIKEGTDKDPHQANHERCLRTNKKIPSCFVVFSPMERRFPTLLPTVRCSGLT